MLLRDNLFIKVVLLSSHFVLFSILLESLDSGWRQCVSFNSFGEGPFELFLFIITLPLIFKWGFDEWK